MPIRDTRRTILTRIPSRAWLFMAVAAWVLLPAAACGAEESRAEIEVSGLGWWDNRESRLSLERLLGEAHGPTLNANAVEDAVFLLMSALEEEGYLQPTVEAVLTRADGTESRHTFDSSLATLLPRPMKIAKARFEIEQGVQFAYESIRFSGLTVLAEDEAEALFGADEGLGWFGRAARAYSPGRLRRSLDALQDRLLQRGYAEANVAAEEVTTDEQTGEVEVLVTVSEGPLWRVASLRVAESLASVVENGGFDDRLGAPWTVLWQQDVASEIRQRYYRAGYPDVRVRVEGSPGAPGGGTRAVDVIARVEPGERVKVGEVRFEGNVRTRDRVLDRRVRIASGDWLNPLEFERVRYRLGALGVFEKVDLRYEPPSGETRDAVFLLDEAPRWEASVLAGYGSYEQLRGGVEWRQLNHFGRAHSSRLQLVQSMKSSRGEYAYTVPELFGELVDGTARIFGFEREEQSFVRQEYGGSVTLRRPAPFIRADAFVGYTFQALRSKDNELETREIDEEEVTVASVDVGLNRDTRDNPLRPRQGYRWYAQVEAASAVLGGEVDYQRAELGVAMHRRVGRGRWIHAGLTHGVLTTFGTQSDRDLPVNKRFYPGGDGSIRGYQAGEASPRAADGRFLGAKTFTLVNLEFEQTITGNWSAVVFVDTLGAAARLAEYPWDERLVSAGLGIRYQTLIGPLRLEYGRNLNPRADDPDGTLHFSVGFPF